jgi:DNA polymerase-4
MATARRLCPQATVLPVRMSHYAEIAHQIREILMAFTPLVEPLSLDEAFLDVRGCEGLFGPAPQIARQVKDRIKAKTGLTASVGVATNKFLAKLASDLGKPNGLMVVPPDQVTAFLMPLAVGHLWGVGARAEKKFHALGIRTIGQLAALPEQVLIDHFGESGRHLFQLAHGLDDRPVVPDQEAKSLSTETTFPHDIGDREVLRVWLLDLVDQLGGRLRRQGLRGRTVELKVRSSDFSTRTRSVSLPEATDLTKVLWQAALALWERTVTREVLPLRLLGVGVTNLTREAIIQGHLFEGAERQRQASLDRAVDTIRQQLGQGAIRRGSLLERDEKEDRAHLTSTRGDAAGTR